MKKILLFQTGNVGDVVITQPLGALLKQLLPGCHITFIGREYVAEAVHASPQFDAFINLPTLLKEQQSDADIILFVNDELAVPVAHWAWRAGIPQRICNHTHAMTAPYCNNVLQFKHERTVTHHALYHLQLLEGLALPHEYPLEEIKPLVGFQWSSPPPIPSLDPNRFNLIIHPGTHGHTLEWPGEYFRELADRLPRSSFHIYLTGSPSEDIRFGETFAGCADITYLMGQLSLKQFLYFISQVDGLVANATGPMHIAGASGVQTLGLFPPRKGLTPTVWAPVGMHTHTLMYPRWLPCIGCKNKPKGCPCMLKISVDSVESQIKSWLAPEASYRVRRANKVISLPDV
jgi:heptosyltransferase-3